MNGGQFVIIMLLNIGLIYMAIETYKHKTDKTQKQK
nr:MAG TPA: hypothetical protein [Caudoviricetes sp.]